MSPKEKRIFQAALSYLKSNLDDAYEAFDDGESANPLDRVTEDDIDALAAQEFD